MGTSKSLSVETTILGTQPRTAAPRRRAFERLRRDFARYYANEGDISGFAKLVRFLDTPGMQAIFVYRFGSWVIRRVHVRLLRLPLLAVHSVLDKLCIICWGISINPAADIGPGLYVGHFGGIIVGPVVMGSDCNIAHQVTLGMRADGREGLPSFGDQVWIGVGSVVYGGIQIGSGVAIAPHTVVSRSVPDRAMVAGNPMRVLSKDYDNHQEIYGRSRDPEARR